MYESCSRSAAPSALMNSSGAPKTFANKGESILILFFCLAAATRVFIFSAAFPFFSNVDEDLHFDLITQYSHGHVPRTFDRLKEETLSWIVPYASPEFLFTPINSRARNFRLLCGNNLVPPQTQRLPPQEPPGAVKLISNPLSRRCITS